MRVLLDTTFAGRGPSGTGVYVEQLARALRAEGVDVVEVANAGRRPPGTGSARNLAGDVRWTQAGLRRAAVEQRADVVHHPLPAHAVALRRPQVVTVHDLAFEALPDAFDARFRRYARIAYRHAAARAAAIVVPSQATADELARRWGITERVVVAPHGPGQELPRRPRGEPRHLLYVGDAEPRKDLPTLLDAYAKYRAAAPRPLPLVLAGSAFSVDSGVRVVERPDAAELADLHAHAAALVHPSRHEGFGLTVLEALAAGTPVIAADTPAVRATAAGRARLVRPGDPDALATALAEPPPDGHVDELPTWRQSARSHIAAYTLALRS